MRIKLLVLENKSGRKDDIVFESTRQGETRHEVVTELVDDLFNFLNDDREHGGKKRGKV